MDITPIAVAIIVVGLPFALSNLYTAWKHWQPDRYTPEWKISTAASDAVKIAQDLRESGYFDAEKTGAAALDWAADWLHGELKRQGIELDVAKCVEAARIAYQEWKTEK